MAEIRSTTNILNVNSVDLTPYVKGLKVGRETIVAETSGRGADGTMTLDVIARKYKLYVTFRPLTPAEASIVASALDWYSATTGLTATFIDPFTNANSSCAVYTGTPNFEYYSYSDRIKLTKDLTVDLIEL